MKLIKVCHIITKLELGGAQQNTLYTVGHLDRTKFTASLISGPGGILDSDASKLIDVDLTFIPELGREISPLNDLIALYKVWKALRKIRPDIVHTHSSKAGIIGRLAAFFARVPVVIHTFHGFGFHDFQRPFVRYVYILTEKVTALVTDKLVAVSIQNIYKGLKYGIGRKEKYILIRSGIETSRYKDHGADKPKKMAELGIKPGLKIVTTIGPFKPQKNLDDFIRAAGSVLKKQPNTVFLVAGDGEQRPHLESLITELKLNGKVRLIGWRRDIIDILSISNVFVLTSLWEGLPRSILEAMCCGLPVVANAVDGVSEIVRHDVSGFLVQPHDYEKTASFVARLLGDESLARTFGTRGSLIIDQEYDINYMVKQQEELYATLIRP
jgi:glycosyltransferase involved in cell wall biosynthesis